MNKSDIRKQIREQKKQLDENQRQAAASRVFTKLETLDDFIKAEHILVYHSLPDELPTINFINRWAERKHLYLPRVNGDDLDILPYRPSHTHQGAFQIEEPDGDDLADIANIDLIIVPAVAYDRQGNRVGRGKGYYDRLLSRAHARLIGVCYAFQLVDSIDSDPHDIPVDMVITD